MPRAPITFDAAQIKQVRRLAPMLTRKQLADFFSIAEPTFDRIRERQPEVEIAYKAGRAEIIGKIAESLIQDALDGDNACRIFFLKTQAGWRETNHVELTGENGGPVQIQAIVRKIVDPAK